MIEYLYLTNSMYIIDGFIWQLFTVDLICNIKETGDTYTQTEDKKQKEGMNKRKEEMNEWRSNLLRILHWSMS